MISNEIYKVSNTKILVAPNISKTRQLVIYSNQINNISKSNVMIIPVPLPQTVQFINLSGYKNIFEDCSHCFYSQFKSYGLNLSTNSINTRDDSKQLEVFNVGNYQVSLAMNLEQLTKINEQVFNISNGLQEILQMFYYQPYWGFIIVKLDVGLISYHPFAYSHNIIDNKIYIPTRHFYKQVEWENLNQWALGLPINPQSSPLNMNNWTEDNIDNSPMFQTQQFGRTSADVNGWLGTNSIDNITNLSDRTNNLKKLNGSNNPNIYSKSSSNKNNSQYEQISNNWNHTIYLFNLNSKSNENLIKMNSCKELWDKNSLFDPEKINFDFGPCHNFEKINIFGIYPNIDFVI
jgi:hypothetical protein